MITDRFGPLTGPNLYTIDSKGKTRFWCIEREHAEGERYRSVSGIVGGEETCSGWTTAKAKNLGRANETSPAEQCAAEIAAEYKKKRDRKYHDDLATAGGSKHFSPMLAGKFTGKLFDETYSQPKLDGIRLIASRAGLFSRNGKPFALPHVTEALEPYFAAHPDLVLDGELYNHGLNDDFNRISSLVKKQTRTYEEAEECARLVQYHVYDMPSCKDTFARRNDAINRLQLDRDVLFHVETHLIAYSRELDEFYASYLQSGYEGQMVRNGQSMYQNKRTNDLLKRKEFIDDEFEVVDIMEGDGNWAGLAKHATCRLPDGRTFGTGIAGTKEMMRDLLEVWREYPGCYKHATIRYFELTPDGIPRFPVAKAWHKGKRED